MKRKCDFRLKTVSNKLLAATWSVLLFIVSAAPTMAWGDKGHQTVGSIAALQVKPLTAAKIIAILNEGESLGSISTWADQVKYRIGEHDPDPDTDAFLQDAVHNKNNNEWHYVDLPLGCENYEACHEFTPEYDIVHLINICIATLQGRPSTSYPLTKRNALRLLVHLVGDLHQPLHVGAGYIDTSNPSQIKIATDRTKIVAQHIPGDRGGNQLIIDNDRANLHSFWDFDLVTDLMNTTQQTTPDGLANFLKQSVQPRANWTTSGPIEKWAAEWATESLRVSQAQAYRGVQIVGQRSIPVLRDGQPVLKDGQPVMQTVYDVSRPADYLAVNREIVKEQLAKAGFRLAKLLDAVFS